MKILTSSISKIYCIVVLYTEETNDNLRIIHRIWFYNFIPSIFKLAYSMLVNWKRRQYINNTLHPYKQRLLSIIERPPIQNTMHVVWDGLLCPWYVLQPCQILIKNGFKSINVLTVYVSYFLSYFIKKSRSWIAEQTLSYF